MAEPIKDTYVFSPQGNYEIDVTIDSDKLEALPDVRPDVLQFSLQVAAVLKAAPGLGLSQDPEDMFRKLIQKLAPGWSTENVETLIAAVSVEEARKPSPGIAASEGMMEHLASQDGVTIEE